MSILRRRPRPKTMSDSKHETIMAGNQAHDKSSQVPPVGTYFFYGPLQDADILREVLQMAEQPALRPAFVKGFILKRWAVYPVMLWSLPQSIVRGHAFIVHSTEDAAKLSRYAESARGFPKPCRIFLEGDGETAGYTFLFRGGSRNQHDLADWKNGSFDLDTDLKALKDWEAAKAAAQRAL